MQCRSPEKGLTSVHLKVIKAFEGIMHQLKEGESVKLFRIDSPFMRALNRIADIMIVNLLFVICSIPVLTIGAAAVAAYKVTQDMVFKTENSIVRSFFRAFRLNLKYSSVVWIVLLLLTLLLSFEMYFLLLVSQLKNVTLFSICILIIAIFLFGLYDYMLPLIARYENTLAQHVKNSFYLFVGNPLRSLIMIVTGVLPIVVPVVFTEFFLSRFYLWTFFAFGLIFYMHSVLLKPVFVELEETALKC